MPNLKDLVIGVVGNGVVGKATARSYLEWAKEVRVYDTHPELSTHTLFEVVRSDLVFICLPTPLIGEALQLKGLDTSDLDTFFRTISPIYLSPNYVIKSTVPIGYTYNTARVYNLTNLVHSPEFLTARCSLQDALLPARNIIGGPNCECKQLLATVLKERFVGTPLILCKSDESEAIKLLTNAYFAVKISYFNEARSICDSLGMDWETVLGGIMLDGRICHAHTRVPGPDGRRGFGGACLEKDTSCLAKCLNQNKLHASMSKAALRRNKRDRE